MDVRYTRDEAGLATLEIIVEAEQVEQIYSRALKDLRRHINVPGFRPGRVPPKMVETIIGREQIAEYAQDLLKEQVYPDALAEVPTLVTLDEPELDLESFERGSEAKLVAKVRSAQVTLGEYSGLPIERWRASVTDEDALAQLKAQHARSAQLSEADHEEAALGDVANITLRVVHDGTLVEDIGEDRPLPLHLGHNQITPSMDEHILGMSIGEQKVFEVEHPEDSEIEQLAGETAEYAVELISLSTVEPFEDWLKRLGAFSSEDEAVAAMRESLVARQTEQFRLRAREAAVEAAINAATIEYPRADIDAALIEEIEQIEDDLRTRGMDDEEIDELVESEMDGIRQRVEYERYRDVVLRALAQIERIELEREDIAQELGGLANANRVDPRLLMRRLEEEGQLGRVAQAARDRKAAEWLYEHALVTEVDPPADHDHDHEHDDGDEAVEAEEQDDE